MLRHAAWLLLAFVLLLVSCSGGEYSIVVRFESPALADQVDRVEVFLVDSCGTLAETGAAPGSPVGRLDLRRGTTTTTFSAVSAGSYGLYGRGFDGATCQVVAAGCSTVTLEAGGSGELVVTLETINGPLCPSGMRCAAGVCGVADAQVPDGGMMDATTDAPVDTSVACSCVSCATCDDAGACIADDTACDSGMYCDLAMGCVTGDPCSSDSDCPDDGNTCTNVGCDLGRGICVPAAVVDGTACTDSTGANGRCRASVCCTGCWDGGACIAGTDDAQCGNGGDRCAGCDDGNPCTADSCTGAGRCTTTPTAGTCPGGTCAGGTCCTGCVEGTSCASGDTVAQCGAAGATCMACDVSACPPERCAAGACMPLGATSVDLRRFSVLAIAPDGSLWAWGANTTGQLGLGDTVDRNTPTQVGSDTDWAQASEGRDHACAVKSGGELFCWGDGADGGTGLGSPADTTVPTRVGSDSDWSMVSCGTRHSCAIKTDGSLWCWGEAMNGSGTSTLVPAQVGFRTDWSMVDTRSEHTCGIRGGGMLYCWGDNSDGQLGIGGTTSRERPDRVGFMTSWQTVATGGSGISRAFTCALQTDGSRWCWGHNGVRHRYGDGFGSIDSTTPIRIDAGPWRSLALGGTHGCAIAMDRGLYCWGDNTELATGHSGGSSTPMPAQVGADTNYTAVGAGSASTCAVKSTGAIVCFGQNADGELGRPGTASLSPVRACL